MKIIDAYVEVDDFPSNALEKIERAGRVCYKSEDKIKKGSAETLIRTLIKSGHESVLEHASVSFKIVCDRGITHEFVRHRICSFSQESTRYCNYSKGKFGNEITVIKPCFWDEDSLEYIGWLNACSACETWYFELIRMGAKPQEARSVLPNSLKAEIFTTANLREWRHILKLRTSPQAHPQAREVAFMILDIFKERLPIIVEDINPKKMEKK